MYIFTVFMFVSFVDLKKNVPAIKKPIVPVVVIQWIVC